MFSQTKATHIAAYFLLKNGGDMPLLKLVKLLYIADRESMNQFDLPMTFYRLVAMPHGPVSSQTLDMMNGFTKCNVWEEFIRDREDHNIGLRKAVIIDDLDELSDAEIEILDNIWSDFGSMDQWQIRDFTHEKFSEWTDPKGSSIPISYEQVFLALGRPPTEAKELANEIISRKTVNKILTR